MSHNLMVPKPLHRRCHSNKGNVPDSADSPFAATQQATPEQMGLGDKLNEERLQEEVRGGETILDLGNTEKTLASSPGNQAPAMTL